MRPLEIRTFLLKNVSLDTTSCKSVDELNYNGNKIEYVLDRNKAMPVRSNLTKENEGRVINYLLN